MKSNKYLLLFAVLALAVFLFSGCGGNSSTAPPFAETDLFMGTVVQIKIYEPVDEYIFDKAFTIIENIENRMSLNISESEISLINKSAGLSPVHVSDDTYEVIEKAVYYGNISKGSFDITIGPLASLWNIGKENARLPEQSEIDAALSHVDYSKISLNPDEHTVFLENSGMMLDLGGIAKGYAADALSEMFNQEGIEHAIINLGGNIYAHGPKPDGENWRIGIQNPEAERNDYIGVASVKNKSVVTSGIYERYFESGGTSYHHILSPFDGYPFENNLSAVSIIAGKSIDADALSTTAFALGLESGLDLLESLPDVEGIFISRDFKVYITSGLKDSFEMSDGQYTLVD